MSGMLADTTGRQKFVRFAIDKLRAGDGAFDTVHDFEFSTGGGFTLSADGTKLYGTSYFTGVSNIFRFDVASGAMDVLSNTETGLYWPIPRPRRWGHRSPVRLRIHRPGLPSRCPSTRRTLTDVNAIKYFGQQVIEKYPIVRDWKLPPAARINVAALTTKAGAYVAWKNLKPAALYPIVEGYKDTASYGARMDFTDGPPAASAWSVVPHFQQDCRRQGPTSRQVATASSWFLRKNHIRRHIRGNENTKASKNMTGRRR